MIKEFSKTIVKEGEMIKTIFVSLLTSFILLAIFYILKLKDISNFMPKYGFYLFFAILSYAFILACVKQIRSYKEFPCMSGMMIGMTIGMVSGFLSALYIGSTNGMFWGSMFGMAVGIFFGAWNGNSCGIMGFMEGIMAGFMGGLMGGMTAIMLLNDNLKAAVIISFLICSVILFGLSYMIFKETKGAEKIHKYNEVLTIALSFLLTILTTVLMVYGPRSILFQ